jgi:hypothetical protein
VCLHLTSENAHATICLEGRDSDILVDSPDDYYTVTTEITTLALQNILLGKTKSTVKLYKASVEKVSSYVFL